MSKKQSSLDHKLLRQQSLDALKMQRLSQGNAKEAAIIGKIATKEMRKADWLLLRNIFNPKQNSDISNIEVPDKDIDCYHTSDSDKAMTWRRLYDPVHIEETLLERNIKHFGQAEGTLFTRTDITEMFDYEGTSTSVNDLLQGKLDSINIPDVTDSACKLLQMLSTENDLPNIENCTSLQEFKNAFAKWNEATSTSPSIRH
jgi:hypothetical protein